MFVPGRQLQVRPPITLVQYDQAYSRQPIYGLHHAFYGDFPILQGKEPAFDDFPAPVESAEVVTVDDEPVKYHLVKP